MIDGGKKAVRIGDRQAGTDVKDVGCGRVMIEVIITTDTADLQQIRVDLKRYGTV